MKKKQENRRKDRKNCVQTAEFEDYCSSDSQDDLPSEECSSEALCPMSIKKSFRKKDKFKATRNIRSRDSTGPSQCK